MKSGLSYLLQHAFAEATAIPTDVGRRDFIKKSALATLALTLPFSACVADNKPTVAIVGGGIAGLTTAYYLKKLNIAHTVYEASGRVGGRVLTVEDAVIARSHVDFGAEFIDAIHDDLLALAKELNVALTDLHTDTLTSKAYYFEGKMLSEKDIVEALAPFAEKILADVNRLPEDFHFSKADEYRALDEQSVTTYLKNMGIDGWLLRFFEVAMEGEYAMNASEQSAINLLVMLSTPIAYSDHYHLLGSYHEVFKFKGGSQKFIDALSAETIENVKLNHKLKQLSKKGNQYELHIESGGKQHVIVADYVVLAIPHTVLRSVVRDFQFTERKEKWIAEAGFGNAVKVAMGFKTRTWREAGYQGYTFTDINRTVFWDSSQLVPTEEGSLTFVGGGDSAVELSTKTYEEIQAKWLTGADTIFKGVKSLCNGRISKFAWSVYPFSKGSYTCYQVGQWSAFAGVEAEPFENILFAGEHCSLKHQGFMNGAVETAKVAVETLRARLEKSSS
jgi:monoamine oxidase